MLYLTNDLEKEVNLTNNAHPNRNQNSSREKV
jgi:hypothetical protein